MTLNPRNAWAVLLCLPWLVLLGWLSAVAWFLCDDAFISFRYARNLLEGHGLVFNPGEYVEGYSNFLWVLELAAIWGLAGIAPERAAPWLSVIFTVGTIGAMLWWVRQLSSSPAVSENRVLVAWMALGLVCSSATFAVWTSGGGLETRQFTFFVLLAVVLLSLYRDRRWGLAVASVSLAAAALTRPEGPLIAVLCCGWLYWQRAVDTGSLRPDLRQLAWLAAPFVLLVAAHYVFRYGYYGEWLPNTYYAMHVRPWYESGWRYLWAAALETGLYLLIPLAVVAMRGLWRESRDGIWALVLLLVGAHMAYVMRVGGDHFEYRPLDFYWPLLAVPASVGVVHLGRRIAEWPWVAKIPYSLAMRARICAIVLFVPILFYSNAIQGSLLFEGATARTYIHRLHIEIDDGNSGWLLAVPGMAMLVAISNDLRRQAVAQNVGTRWTEHRAFANNRILLFKPYEAMKRGFIPDDAVMAEGSLGVKFYYLPDLRVIDTHGLTDAIVARNPVTRPNHERIIAHDREPPPGYLEERGVNVTVYHAVASGRQALRFAQYGVKFGPNLWMPFDATDRDWAFERFPGRDVRSLGTVKTLAQRQSFDGGAYIRERLVASFENGFDGWLVSGEAITNHGQHRFYRYQSPIRGHVGRGFLTTFHLRVAGHGSGTALSPVFVAEAGQHLLFLIAGGAGHGVGARLLADGEEVAVWRGENSERFAWVAYPLSEVAGKGLQLELFDNETDDWQWDHIMLDHVVLARQRAGGSS